MKLKDIEKMHADGLLTAEQMAAAIERYKPDTRSSNRWLAYSLSSLAVLLIAGGAFMLGISHWHEITPLTKLGSGMGLMAAAWLAYFALHKSKPLVAESLSTLGSGLWLANIFLINFIFEPDISPTKTCAVFFCGIALIPFLVRQRLLVGVVAVTSIVLLTLILEEQSSLLKTHQMTILALYSLLALFWWLIGEKSSSSKGVLKGYYWISVPAFLGYLFAMQIFLLYHAELSFKAHAIEYNWALYISGLAVALLLKPKAVEWVSWLFLTTGTLALLPAVEYLSNHPDTLTGTIIGAAYALILMFAGMRCCRLSWINYGALMGLFVLISVMINIIKSLEFSGVTLIICGIVLLLLSIFLEGQRRRLVRKAKENKNTTSTPSQA